MTLFMFICPIVCADVYVVEQFSCLSQREEVWQVLVVKREIYANLLPSQIMSVLPSLLDLTNRPWSVYFSHARHSHESCKHVITYQIFSKIMTLTLIPDSYPDVKVCSILRKSHVMLTNSLLWKWYTVCMSFTLKASKGDPKKWQLLLLIPFKESLIAKRFLASERVNSTH